MGGSLAQEWASKGSGRVKHWTRLMGGVENKVAPRGVGKLAMRWGLLDV